MGGGAVLAATAASNARPQPVDAALFVVHCAPAWRVMFSMSSATAMPIEPLVPPLFEMLETLDHVAVEPIWFTGPADAICVPAFAEFVMEFNITSFAFVVIRSLPLLVVPAAFCWQPLWSGWPTFATPE